LSKAQSLEKITIFRCPKMTEKSAVSFSQMKNLKQLRMDPSWPDDAQEALWQPGQSLCLRKL
jgi:hypothetical protein